MVLIPASCIMSRTSVHSSSGYVYQIFISDLIPWIYLSFPLYNCKVFDVCHTWMVWRRQWHPTPVLLPGKSHGWSSLEGCSPWGRWGSDTTEQLRFYFSLSCIGEGNGNPLQCSCLENPRDGGAWWAAVSGVAQSRTQLRWLSSSSSSIPEWSSGFPYVLQFKSEFGNKNFMT